MITSAAASRSSTTYADLYTKANLRLEAERLRRLSNVFDPDSKRVLESVGLRNGMRCLDVGAGIGTITNWIADRVGDGEVVALDRETAVLVGACQANVTIVKADLTAQSTNNLVEPGSFDLIHVRSVLGVLADPAATLRLLYRWLAPDGSLVVSDMWPSLFRGTMGPALRKVLRVTIEMVRRTVGVDVEWATRLPQQLAELGLTDINMHVTTPLLTADSELAEMLRLGVALTAEPLLAKGLLTQKEIDTALTELSDVTLVAAPQVMITGWGRKRVSFGS